MPYSTPSARAKYFAQLTGQPPQPRGLGARAQCFAQLTGQPPRPLASARTQAMAPGPNSPLQHLGKTRAFPGTVMGAKELVGQVLHLTNGQSCRITGLEVHLPDTAETFAGQKHYGASPDATRVAARPRPLPSRRAAPWQPPYSPPTAFINPAGPRPYHAPPLDLTPIGQPLDKLNTHWNGVGAVLEGHNLTYASKSKIVDAFYRGTQGVNRLAGHKLVPPSHVSSGTASVLRSITSSRLAKSSGKLMNKLEGVGIGLSIAKITYEVKTSSYDAHTFVDGGMVVVSIAGIGLTVLAAGTAPAWVPVAGAVILVYGLLDYAFDVGSSVDAAVGRDSRLKSMWQEHGMGR